MKKYVSPEAIKVNFGVNDICATSGMLQHTEWNYENGWDAVMKISWTELISGNNQGDNQ